jgi:glycosyltransferase involved in cell wall biosynthesis
VFVDCAPLGDARQPVRALEGLANLTWRTHGFATRATNPLKLAVNRVRQKLAQLTFRCGGPVLTGALSARVFGLENLLREIAADIYLAHNIETLLPAFHAAQRRGALVMFDSMEFHSDMGDAQTVVERNLVRTVEKSCLPLCALVLASSAQVADALAAEYGSARPLPLDNASLVEKELPVKPPTGLQLYWRNAVVGLGQRGLDDALVALTKLPDDVTLHLQGRWPTDGGAALRTRIAELGLTARVVFHPPFAPELAVQEASRHHVGLCLERRGCRNHDLTVSNKIFDYHMAGLAVVASDLPGLRGVVERSGGGLLFAPGAVEGLTAQIQILYRDAALREQLADSARAFALREGNRETEMKKFTAAFRQVCHARLGREF